MFNFQSFFNSKPKIFVVLIPFLILVIFSTVFFLNQSQSSQNKQNFFNSSSSISTSSANSTNPNSPREGYEQNSGGVFSISQNSAISTTNQKTNQTYTNPNYPDLKINYDDSWKSSIEKRKTSDNDSKDKLMNERLILTKNDTYLIFDFLMPQTTEFGLTYRSKEKILADLGKLKRYSHDLILSKYLYNENGKNPVINIKTNLTKNNLNQEDAKYIIPDAFSENKLNYQLIITLESLNNAEIAQADKIIKSSILE